ncbi:MAG: HAD-IA family hydrolase [Pseudomonadota bacterium]
MTDIKAVIFDVGGVLTTAPYDNFHVYERENGLPENFLNHVCGFDPAGGAWARFERSEITPEEFDAAFAEDSLAHPMNTEKREVRGATLLSLMQVKIRPEMIAAVHACKARFKVGCITNTTAVPVAKMGAGDEGAAEMFAAFDHVIESHKAGVRKPDPRIYEMMCEALGVAAAACVFLDDLGVNLKPAKAMGMRTIRVREPAAALDALSAVTGLSFTKA